MVENKKEATTVSSSIRDFINILVLNGIISTKDTDIEALEYPEIIHKVAKYIKGNSIDDLANVVINSRNAKYISTFATYIDGAPIERLMFGVVASDATVLDKLIYLFSMKEQLPDNDEGKKQIYNKVLNVFVNMTIAEGDLTNIEDLLRYAPTDEIKEQLRHVRDSIKLENSSDKRTVQ